MTSPLKFKQQFDWVLLLVDALQEPKTVEELQDLTSNCERSIYRWIDHLKDMGFEIRRGGKKNARTFQITNINHAMKRKCLQMASICDQPKTVKP